VCALDRQPSQIPYLALPHQALKTLCASKGAGLCPIVTDLTRAVAGPKDLASPAALKEQLEPFWQSGGSQTGAARARNMQLPPQPRASPEALRPGR